MANPKTPPVPKVHHYVRTMTAALLGAMALVLVSASILVVWADRTLTDTTTYVHTVGPLLSSTALQNFVADKVADQLTASTQLSDLANNLLTPSQIAANPQPQQQAALIKAVIHASVVTILQSPQLQAAWTATNQTAHAQLISQLNANAPNIALNLGPLVDAATAQMKQTKLAPVADQINLTPSSATIVLKGAPLERVHSGYNLLREVPWLVVSLALLLAGLSVWASVHHAKTLRRMLIETGLSSLVVAGVIEFAGTVKLPSTDPAAAQMATSLTYILLHGLQVACLILGVVCLLVALGSKLYSRAHNNRTLPASSKR